MTQFFKVKPSPLYYVMADDPSNVTVADFNKYFPSKKNEGAEVKDMSNFSDISSPVEVIVQPSIGDCILDCFAERLGLSLTGTGMVAAGQPLVNKGAATAIVNSTLGNPSAMKYWGRGMVYGQASKLTSAAEIIVRVATNDPIGKSRTFQTLFRTSEALSFWAPTNAVPLAMTSSVSTFLARWIPWVGWGLLAYDVLEIMKCLSSNCMKSDGFKRGGGGDFGGGGSSGGGGVHGDW